MFGECIVCLSLLHSEVPVKNTQIDMLGFELVRSWTRVLEVKPARIAHVHKPSKKNPHGLVWNT